MARSSVPESRSMTLEEENDLRQFLKVARPQWSRPRQGPSDITRVIAKLKDIGVTDTETLVHRIRTNTLNDELTAKRHVPLSREAIESIRKHSPFIRTLESVDAPHIRQTGIYAPVPQLLSRKRLLGTFAPPPGNAGKTKSSSSSPCQLGKSSSTPSHIGMASTHSEGFFLPDRGGSCNVSVMQESVATDDVLSALPSPAARLRGANARSRHQLSRLRLAAGGNEGENRRTTSYLEDSVSAISDESRCTSRSHAATNAATSFPRLVRQGAAGTPQSQGDPDFLALNAAASASTTMTSQTSLKAMASAKVFINRLSDAVQQKRNGDGEARLPQLNKDGVSEEEVARLRQVGAAMGASKREARWSNTGTKAPQILGEEMLCEQEALDDRAELLRQAQSDDASVRTHLAGNIRSRLQQELKAQGQEALNVQQKCMNIKKNLADMTAFRRELSGLKAQVELLNGESSHKNDDALKDLGSCFAGVKRRFHHEVPADGALSDLEGDELDEIPTSPMSVAAAAATSLRPNREKERWGGTRSGSLRRQRTKG